MVNLKVNKSKITLAMTGDLATIVSELVYAIDCAHQKICEVDEDQGDAFEDVLMMGLMHAFHPDETEEAVSEVLESIDDELAGIDEAIDALKDLRRSLK